MSDYKRVILSLVGDIMTVKELIEILEKEDKEKQVVLDANMDNDLEIKEVFNDVIFVYLKN